MKIRRILRSAFNHPFLLFAIVSLLPIYKYLPSLFSLLLAASPTILFTTILLAIVLTNSEPNVPENRNAANQFNRTRALAAGQVREHEPMAESESSKLDDSGSESEIIPTLDEIHPLLESGLESKDVSDSEPEFASDNASIGEETEKEDEAEKARKVVTWTADDQKNLMSVGSSEIERNTRLEHLIARRKAVRKLLERDLIDLEGMDSSLIQPVIAPRMNPFDLPYEEEVPGSAPSVLLPTVRNPFDIHFEQHEENGPALPHDGAHISSYAYNSTTGAGPNFTSIHSTTGIANQDFKRNALYRRHESFTLGAPVVYMEDVRPEPRASRFKPFFIPEGLDGIESDTEKETSERSSVYDESSAEKESSIAHDAFSESSSSDEMVGDGVQNEIEEESSDQEMNKSSENKRSYGISSMTEGSSQIMEASSASSSSDTESDHETVSNAEHLDEQRTVEVHTAEPVYDSSPSAHEKLDDSLFETNNKTDAKELSTALRRNSSEEVWVAPSLASVEEFESRSREVSEIRETDVIGARLSGIRGDLSHPIAPMSRLNPGLTTDGWWLV